MITVYIWKIKDGDKELIDKMLLTTIGDNKETPEYELVELESNSRVNKRGIALCMGSRPFNIVSSEYPEAVKLPQLSELISTGTNREARIQAWEILTNLKKSNIKLDTELELTPEDISKNLIDKSKDIKKIIDENKTEYWIGTTVLGKKVLISNQTTTPIVCNFKITFEELYAAKLAFELLGLKSLTLVKGKEDDQKE